jgi:hypothetical protein
MSRPRKPTAALALAGAFKKNPNRARPDEPKDARALGDPPGRLPVEVVAYWDEIVAMVPAGVLTYWDRWAVELAARLMEKATRETSPAVLLELVREAELDVDEAKNLVKQNGITAAELSTLRSLLASLGMTPADRTKLSVPTEKPKNAFADFAAEALPN